MDRRKLLKLAAPALLLPSHKFILPDAKAQWSSCGAGFCNNGVASSGVTIDAIATPAAATGAQSISLNMTVGASANAMLISQHFAYSAHGGFTVTWVVGGTTQTFQSTANFDFILTSDNGASAPAIALIGLLNPTPGAGTLTMSFTSAADDLVMEAVTFNGVNTLGGLSGAFTGALFTTGTSTSAAQPEPPVPGGIQVVVAGGISSSPTSWNQGTQMYKLSSGGTTWGAGVYSTTATITSAFVLGISSSVFWAAAGVTVNPTKVFSPSPILNISNPLTSGLIFAIPCLGAGTLTDLVTSKTASTAGGITTDTSGGYHGGIAVPQGSTTAKADFGVWQPFANGVDFSMVVLANPPVSSNQLALLGQCDAAAAGFIDFLANTNYQIATNAGGMAGGFFNGAAQGADDGARSIINNGTVHVARMDGGYHCWGLRLASGVPTIWCDGAQTTQNSANVTGTYVNGSQHFAVGNLGNYTGAAFSAGCSIILALGFNSALSDANMGSITSSSFQVLA